MAEPILSGYLSNLGKYTEGRPAGEWVTFPTTAEHLKEVFDRIGIDFKHYEEWHFTEFQSTIPGLTEHLSEYSHPDELNYLGKLLEMQFDDDREKFIAAIEYGDHADSLQDIINLAQNLDCYWIYPSVHNEEEYGRYLVDELEEPELPEEAKKYFMYEEYGRDAVKNDGGIFTAQGYIYNNKNTFSEWYSGHERHTERIQGYELPAAGTSRPGKGGNGRFCTTAAIRTACRSAGAAPGYPDCADFRETRG